MIFPLAQNLKLEIFKNKELLHNKNTKITTKPLLYNSSNNHRFVDCGKVFLF